MLVCEVMFRVVVDNYTDVEGGLLETEISPHLHFPQSRNDH